MLTTTKAKAGEHAVMPIKSGRGTSEYVQHSLPLGTYRLKYKDDGRGLQRDIEFEAYDASMALAIAHREAEDRWAELWRDGRKLCTIRRTGHDVWEIRADGPGDPV